MDDLIDAEWAWVASQLQDPNSPAAAALRGYLNDRITERLVSARADERERLVLTYGGSVAMAAVRADERERLREAVQEKSDYWHERGRQAWDNEQTHLGSECGGRVQAYNEVLEMIDLGGLDEVGT